MRGAALCRSPQDLADAFPLPDLHGEAFALTAVRPCYREFGLEDRQASYLTPPAPAQSPLVGRIDTVTLHALTPPCTYMLPAQEIP